MTRSTADQSSDERGSVVMAMLVLLVLGGLTLSALTYSQSSLRTAAVRTLQDRALGGVDVAMAEATARIELGETASFAGTGALDDVSYRYDATRITSLDWAVYAQATATGVGTSSTTAATANVSGAYRGDNPYALFAASRLNLGIDNPTISEPLGTNGSATVSRRGAGLLMHTFTPLGSCVGCTRTESLPGPRPIAQPTTPTSSRSCPLATLTQSNGTRSTVYGFLGTIDGQNGVPYRCTFDSRNAPFGHRPAIIYQTITIRNPPLIIHVDQNVTLWYLRANVNPTGKARDFQVQAVGGPSTAGGYEYGQLWDDGMGFVGTLDAPMRSLTSNSVNVTGKIVLGSVDVSRGSFSVVADPSVVDAATEWTIDDWKRVSVR